MQKKPKKLSQIDRVSIYNNVKRRKKRQATNPEG